MAADGPSGGRRTTDRGPSASAVARYAAILVSLAIACMPMAVNGGPFVFADTFSYLSGGTAAVEKALGVDLGWREQLPPVHAEGEGPAEAPEAVPTPAPAAPAGAGSGADAGAATTADPGIDARISMARSVYYSVGLTALTGLGGPVLPALMQIGVMVAALAFLCRAVLGRVVPGALIALTAVATLTQGAVTASLLMPDIFAAIGILGAALLVGLPHRLGRADRVFWGAMLALAVLSHNTHLALTAGLLILGGAVALVLRTPGALTGGLIVGATVASGIAGIFAFKIAVEQVYGYTPRPLPMIAASLISDGTGRDLLRRQCKRDPDRWVYCPWRQRFFHETDHFLWSRDPDVGVYLFVDAETQAAMSDQQIAFARATIARFPLRQTRKWSWRFARQLTGFSVDFLDYNQATRATIAAQAPLLRAPIERTLAVDWAFPHRLFDAIGLAALTATPMVLGVIGWRLARRGGGGGPGQGARAPERGLRVAQRAPAGPMAPVYLWVLVGMVVAAVLANALITGLPSQPQGRYQSRVVWLLPVLAMLALIWFWRERRPAPATDG
ncbi:MAG: hypothetical protein AAFV86_12920 [Pseudomonadota bacterium]